ncbi:hypothetical protein M413DRAFT_443524 [Hebeloma cylindrosporum]|uniref:Extracellular membrane protein CFEM domain-containing protein n=1 Tax=Hebeloma cylindrosporum TaxID=76867 RepID=A0A0C3C434_HEBCY|nr:hypothetical protein M413DRAFT_443524 [Hebeloma cylindrosporum h7]
MVAFFALATSFLMALPSVLAEPISTPATLYARQISGFDPGLLPSGCLQSKCQAFIDSITAQNCMSLECLCTTTIANAMKTCLQCAVDAHVTDFDQNTLDTALKDFTDSCSGAGHPISGVTSGGGSGSASTTDASPSGTDAATSPSGTDSATTKSGAVAQMTVSILGAVFAVAVGGAALA